jgi:hypothetical protein
MGTVIRRWYIYNGAPGGQLNNGNYYYISNFGDPFFNACSAPANNICVILGVYSVTTPGGFTTTYGTIPQTFALDTKLGSYINQALATASPAPVSPFAKRYVYVKYFN